MMKAGRCRLNDALVENNAIMTPIQGKLQTLTGSNLIVLVYGGE